jgi:hypothetical protein
MKLSPMLQYRLAFWSITGPLLIPMAVVLILAIFNPFWFRDDMLRWCERLAGKWGKWRDDVSYVKNSYDKAHLFETIKGKD